MLAIMWQRLQRLHSDESGQVLWLFVVSGLALVVLAALVFNTGKQATRRMEMQNAVDATAVSGATWIARGMNVVSMDNVAMTELLGLIANLQAIRQSIPINRIILETEDGIADALMSNPFTAAAGIALKIGVILGTLETDLVDAVSPLMQKLADPPNGVLWEFMRGLSGFSRAMTVAAPALAFVEGYNVGTKNISWLQSSRSGGQSGPQSATEGAFFLPTTKWPPDLQSLGLPAEPGSFQELCDPTHYGTHSTSPVDTRGYHPFLGYDYGKGPFEKYKDYATRMWLPSAVSLIPVWYRGVADMNLEVFCHGGDAPSIPKIPVRTSNLAEARSQGAAKYVWIHSWVSTAPIDQDPAQPPPNENDINFEPLNSAPGAQLRQPTKQLLQSGVSLDGIVQQAEDNAAAGPSYQPPVDSKTYGSEVLNTTAAFQPPGKQIGNWVWTQTSTSSEPVEIQQEPQPAKPVPKTRYVITEDRYTFEYATINKSFDNQLKTTLNAGNSDQYPQPYHFVVDGQKLDDPSQLPQAVQTLQYLAVAHVGDTDQPWLGGLKVSIRGQSRPVFANHSAWGMLTYAQAQVYNPTSWDLYTQDWHVKLVPATLFDQFLDSGTPGGAALGGITSVVKDLNAH